MLILITYNLKMNKQIQLNIKNIAESKQKQTVELDDDDDKKQEKNCLFMVILKTILEKLAFCGGVLVYVSNKKRSTSLKHVLTKSMNKMTVGYKGAYRIRFSLNHTSECFSSCSSHLSSLSLLSLLPLLRVCSHKLANMNT